MLKQRFSCLPQEMRPTPDRVCAVVVACATLHNFALQHNDLVEDPLNGDLDQPTMEAFNDHETGAAMRQHITNAHFA